MGVNLLCLRKIVRHQDLRVKSLDFKGENDLIKIKNMVFLDSFSQKRAKGHTKLESRFIPATYKRIRGKTDTGSWVKISSWWKQAFYWICYLHSSKLFLLKSVYIITNKWSKIGLACHSDH